MKKKFLKIIIVPLVVFLSGCFSSSSSINRTKQLAQNANIDLGTTEMFLDEVTKSSIGFYFDIELNQREPDVWEASHLLTSESNVVQRYSSATQEITTRAYPFFKINETKCWMSLNEADVGDIFFINGTFSDNQGYHLSIKPIYVSVVGKTLEGITVACDTPKITIFSSTCQIKKTKVLAYETSSTNDLLYSVDKGNLSITYSSGAVSGNTFVRKPNEIVTSHTITAQVTYNHFSYTVDYPLLVGVHDFDMAYGASISTDGSSSCELRFTATVPHLEYSKFSQSDIKFVVVPKNNLHGYTLNYENLFGTNRVFTFNPLETSKFYLKTSNHVSVRADSNYNYTITGSIKGILPSDYLTQYVGLCIFENPNNERVIANFENNDQLSNTRSPYQVAVLAYDNGNHSLYNKYIAPIETQSVNCFIRCFNADSNNALISSSSVTGSLFKEVSAPTISNMRATIKKHRLSGEGNYIDFFYSKDCGSDYDVYAWDTPELDTENNFDNEYTASVAKTMRDAGITVAITSGHAYRTIYNDSDISYFKYLIQAYYKNGIKTAIQIGGSNSEHRHFYESAPDFSMCPGFYGYLEWDEPDISILSAQLSKYATQFNETYRGTNHKFIVNLHPSHATSEHISNIYTDYLQSYCTNVLEKLDVEHRFLSVDNYPFSKVTSSIQANTIHDMALVTLYGHEYKALTSFCLQSCGWDDTLGEDDSHMRAPSAGEMKMIVYDALCFGIDTISWFTYSANKSHYQDYEENGGQYVTPVNRDNTINNEIYNGLQSANACWKEGKTLLDDYSYRGTYVYSSSSWTTEAKPFRNILNNSTWTMDRGGRYYISNITSMTNSLFTSASSSNSYLIGVYENSDGEQAYVINNYICKDKVSTSINIKMNKDVIVTQNGTNTDLSSGTSKQFTITQGSGLIVRKA